RIRKLADAAPGKRVRYQSDLGTADFTPRTRISVTQLHEKNRPVEFRAPFGRVGFRLASFNLYEGARAEQRVHRVILNADISILTSSYVQLLDQRHRYLTPDFDHAGDETGFLQREALVEADREGDCLLGIRSLQRGQMSVLERQCYLVACACVQVDAKH